MLPAQHVDSKCIHSSASTATLGAVLISSIETTYMKHSYGEGKKQLNTATFSPEKKCTCDGFGAVV